MKCRPFAMSMSYDMGSLDYHPCIANILGKGLVRGEAKVRRTAEEKQRRRKGSLKPSPGNVIYKRSL